MAQKPPRAVSAWIAGSAALLKLAKPVPASKARNRSEASGGGDKGTGKGTLETLKTRGSAEGNDVSRRNVSGRQDARVQAPPSGMDLRGDPRKPAGLKRACDVLARVGGLRNLEEDRADADPHARSHQRPVDSRNREVLAGGACLDRMPLGAQSVDPFPGEEAHRAVGPPVIAPVALPVARHSLESDLHRPRNRPLGDAAPGNLDRLEAARILENGGVFAMPNLRGGGEYGEDWHQAGMLMKKQNVFDDFIAAAEYLIAQKYTSKEKLGIGGGSNGGLLVGACMTQRPDLFKVALPAVGVMDMLRYHKFTVGKGWIPEYGSSEEIAEMFNYLKGYSPVHNLKPGTAYPATMITTGDHDDRVVPAHSFKFAAGLQAAHKGDNPVLIRIETDAGHGAGKPTSKVIDEVADVYSFFFYNTKTAVKYNVKG